MMTDEEKQWARLIDGEMSFAEQRALIASLDETPDGWKRLALGLLEAQVFRREFQAVAAAECGTGGPTRTDCGPHRVDSVSASKVPIVAADRRQSNGRRLIQVLMSLVIGVVSLGLGMKMEQSRQSVSVFSRRSIPVATPLAGDVLPPRQTLKFVFADQITGAQTIEVPVIDDGGTESTELLRQSAVSDELRQKLEEQGYVIYEERKFVPVTLANGRQGIAPVSDVVVEPQPIVFQ